MNKIFIKLIQFYQKSSKNQPKHCKYNPTCSNYSLEAYLKFNFFKATFLSLWRIIRCNPFSKGGYNPVPPNDIEKFYNLIINI